MNPLARYRWPLPAVFAILGLAAALGAPTTQPSSAPSTSSGQAAPGAPSTQPADAAWGEVNDGLTCRVTLQKEYCLGQAVRAVIQFKNTSDKERVLYGVFDPAANKDVTVQVTGPKGTLTSTKAQPVPNFGMQQPFAPVPAGEVAEYVFGDLRCCFEDPAAFVPGDYTVSYTYKGQKPTVMDPRTGQPVPVKDTDELALKAWTQTVTATGKFTIVPLAKEDLIVHEWGVFTVFNDVDYANANMRAEWSSLPPVLYRQFPDPRLRFDQGGMIVKKPFIYFYSPRAGLSVEAKVTFTKGAPVVWWPAVATPTTSNPGRGPDGKAIRGPLFRDLTWQVWLGPSAPSVNFRNFAFRRGGGQNTWEDVAEFDLPKDCWLRDARLPDASLLTAVGSSADPRRAWQPQNESERFLYYDGLMPAPDSLRCENVSDQGLTIRNKADFDIARLFIVDRRSSSGGAPGTGAASGGGGVRFYALTDAPLKANTLSKLDVAAPVPARDWPAAGVRALHQALRDAGLFEAEAQSALKFWSKTLFESEGITAFYLLPQSAYDKMLPLTLKPQPLSPVVRVGIVLHPNFEGEPAVARQAQDWLKKLDDDDPSVREAATTALIRLGPVAMKLVRDAAANPPSAEVAERCKTILKELDTADWVK
jgi:hypothetical protein